jgi:hypothetical protein
VDEARQTLGLWIAMNGNQYIQVLELIAKVLEWADKIRTKELTRMEAWLSLRMGIAKALQYPLAATNMSKAECKLIVDPRLGLTQSRLSPNPQSGLRTHSIAGVGVGPPSGTVHQPPIANARVSLISNDNLDMTMVC